MISFEVEGLRGKGRPRFRSCGSFFQTYTDKETASYENLVKLSFLNCSASNERYLDNQPLRVRLFMYQAIPSSTSKKKKQLMLLGKIYPTKKPDIDNVCKAIFDALNGVAFKDDTQIVELEITKRYSIKEYVKVEIEEITI